VIAPAWAGGWVGGRVAGVGQIWGIHCTCWRGRLLVILVTWFAPGAGGAAKAATIVLVVTSSTVTTVEGRLIVTQACIERRMQ